MHAAAADFQYFPATITNTTLADGTALKVVDNPGANPEEITSSTTDAKPNNHWHRREAVGSGSGPKAGVFAADGARGNDAPMLCTMVGGLKPNADYQVIGFFWMAGFVTNNSTPVGDKQWDIRFGCGKARMMGYSHRDNTGMPGTIGRRDGDDGVARQSDDPLIPKSGKLIDRDADRCLLSAPLGTQRTDAKGTLIVYVDDQPDDSNNGRTWYDGIGVLPSATKADVGSGAPGALHLAVRAGDWEMARRELAAKADPNTLDKDGLTPLFYAAAAGDHERVAWLLKAGAKPEVARQALSPLWAAATSGDVELTKSLLQAGAKVPPGPIDPATLSVLHKTPALLHPAVAAMRSGSVTVLKLLLEQQPKLDLDALFERDWKIWKEHAEAYEHHKFPRPHVLDDAIRYHHPEMAGFLIRHGCRVDGIEYDDSGHDNKQETEPRSMLIAAILAHPAMTGVVDALAQRGCPMVSTQLPSVTYKTYAWDGLSAAAAVGDSALVARLLPLARNVGQDYQLRLLLLAEASGEPAVAELVRQQYPDLKVPQWKPRNPNAAPQAERYSNNETLRQLLPRERPPAKRRALEGDRVLAVIAAPDASGQGAALAAEASKLNGWKVVEREEVETLLRERDFANPWAAGRHNFAVMGDRLAADVLVFVTLLSSDSLSILQFETVDVASGLALERRHVDAKEFKPAQFSIDYLTEVRGKLQERLDGHALTAVTMLGLTAEADMTSQTTLETTLRIGLLREIDATPGMISMTRDQMQPVVMEKTFQKPGALWGAAWTIEGGIAPLGGQRIELGLRLRSLGTDGKSHDVKVAGAHDELPRMVREAWKNLLAAAGNTAPPKERDPKAAATEAARLLREAEWLANLNRPAEALPMVEAALFLGADPLRAVPVQLASRLAVLISRNPTAKLGGTSDPRMPVLMQIEAAQLGESLELLRLSSETLTRYRAEFVKRGDFPKIYWSLLYEFVSRRTLLQPQRMDKAQLALWRPFDTELTAFARNMLESTRDNEDRVSYFEHFEDYEVRHFEAVPVLPEMIAEAITRQTTRLTTFNRSFFRFIEADSVWRFRDIGSRTSKGEILCRHLEKAMQGRDIPIAALRRAEIAFIRSTGETRTQAARDLMEARTLALTHNPTNLVECVRVEVLSRWVPMIGEGNLSARYDNGVSDLSPLSPNMRVPAHGDLLLAGLLQRPYAAPDLAFRQAVYLEGEEMVTFELDPKIGRSADYIAFRQRLIGDAIDLAWRNPKASPTALDLLEGAGLLDRCLGTNYRRPLEARFAPLLKKGDVDILTADAVFDLRGQLADKAAFISHPFIEPQNRRILWLQLQPVLDWNTPLENRFPIGRPWLVAVDCVDRKFVQQIDLAASPGLWPGGSPRTMKQGFLGLTNDTDIASDSAFLLSVYWGDRVDSSGHSTALANRYSNTTVTIDRKTGKVTALPKRSGSDLNHGGGGDYLNRATAIGESFFFVSEDERQDIYDDKRLSLWHLKPDGTLKMLALSGRRPELSPFDALDREIDFLRAAGNRLLVCSKGQYGAKQEFYAYYDPKSETWEVVSRDAGMRRVSEIEVANYNTMIFPHNMLKMQGAGANILFFAYEPKSGCLTFQRGNNPQRHDLPVALKVPESYQATFNFNKVVAGQTPQEPTVGVADALAKGKFTTVVLNQTDQYLILGLTVHPKPSWDYQTSDYQCLPFLWYVSKDKALAAIRRLESGNK